MSAITGITTCKICGQNFAGPSMLIIGVDQLNGVAAYFKELAKHVMETHPSTDQDIVTYANSFFGLLRLECFTTTDSALMKQRDQLRWAIHQKTFGPRVPANEIQNWAAAAAAESIKAALVTPGNAATIQDLAGAPNVHPNKLEAALTREIAAKLNSIRDLYEEAGKYTAPGDSPAAAPQTRRYVRQ